MIVICQMPVLAQSGTPHKYTIKVPTNCSGDNTFSQLQQPGYSAPGAPAAQEHFTPRIPLFGITSANPISQDVNSSTRTQTNTTLGGHVR
jgi:hypothetical protein